MSNPIPAGQYVGALRASRSAAGLELAETEYRPGLVVPAHAHDEPLAFLLLDGGMTEIRGRQRIPCGAGTLIYHPSEEPHAHRFHEAGGRCLVMQFRSRWTERLEALGLTLADAPLDLRRSRAGWLAGEIHRELRSQDGAADLAIEGFALAMLGEIARAKTRQERSVRPAWLIRTIELLHDRLHESVTMAEIAAAVGVHPVHLSRTFSEHYGCTMGDYLRRIRVERARADLVRTDKPLTAIALDAGFADQAHFSRVFKALVGQTPGSFRRSRTSR